MTASILSPFSTTAKPGDSMLTLTHLDITTTQRAFEQGKQAYASQNYSQAIDLYTHALDLLQSELESVILLHRATAHEKRKEYHRAADDAKRANPYNNLTRPDPYLVGANIFLLQKRWHEAANVYKRGAILVPNTYRERSVLTDNYQHLTMVIHKNNQWIAEVLPYEVVSQILSYMSTTDCVRLASTCHFWRNFILQQQGSSSLWYTLHIAEMMTKTAIGPFLYSIPADKPRMITLKRTDKDNLSLLDGVSAKILGIVNDRRWDNLESIEAWDCGPGVPLENILKRNQNSLTTLILHTWVNSLIIDKRDPMASSLIAARTCPNLQYISQHFVARYIGDQLPTIPHILRSHSSSTTETSSDLYLTKLVLRNGMDEDTGLVPLLEQASQLESFTLNSQKYRNFTRILTLLSEYCPNIQEFIYMGTSDSRLCTTLYTSQQQTSSAGIKTIKLKFWSMDLGTTMDDEPISAVFRRCHTTLETLELDMGTLLASRYKCLDILASLGAPQLRNLVLNLHDDTIDGETVTRFITASPALQLVDIQGSGFWTPELFDALGSLTELEKLSIYQTHYDDDDDDCADIGDDVDTPPHIKEEKPGIIQNGHWLAPVLVCKHSKLVEFTYRHNNSNEDTAFLLDLAPSLAQSTIQKLHLQDISIQNGDVLSVILEHLARSQTLHTLRVWLPFDIMEKDIIAFASIENLAYLDIWDTHGAVTKEMMYNVFRHLEKRDRFIFIRGDDPDSDHTVKGYTHGTSLQPLFKKKSSGRITDQEENFIIEEYLGSD